MYHSHLRISCGFKHEIACILCKRLAYPAGIHLNVAKSAHNCRSICRGSLALSTKVKLQQLMSVSFIASMGIEHVFCNVMHRFKSSFLDAGSILFRQGDPVLESSLICIIANGKAKVLVDPKYVQFCEQSTACDNSSSLVAATSEAGGCRCVPCQEARVVTGSDSVGDCAALHRTSAIPGAALILRPDLS